MYVYNFNSMMNRCISKIIHFENFFIILEVFFIKFFFIFHGNLFGTKGHLLSINSGRDLAIYSKYRFDCVMSGHDVRHMWYNKY